MPPVKPTMWVFASVAADNSAIAADASRGVDAVGTPHGTGLAPAHSGFFSSPASSPMTPRRKASTQTTKMMPCTTITQPPS